MTTAPNDSSSASSSITAHPDAKVAPEMQTPRVHSRRGGRKKTGPKKHVDDFVEEFHVEAWPDAPRTLTKDEINELPIRAYGGDICVVRTEEEMERALNLLWKEKVLGFDTETRPVFTKGQSSKPALLQLGGAECVFLFQFNHVPFCEALADLLADPHIVKTGVAVRDDMRALARIHEFTAGGAVDLAHLAKARGVQAQGLRSLAAALLGFRISKSAQCSNWEKEELSPRQVLYAATDAWVGRELYFKLA